MEWGNSPVNQEGSGRMLSLGLWSGMRVRSACRVPTCSRLFCCPQVLLFKADRGPPRLWEPAPKTHALGRAHAHAKMRRFTPVSAVARTEAHCGRSQACEEGGITATPRPRARGRPKPPPPQVSRLLKRRAKAVKTLIASGRIRGY